MAIKGDIFQNPTKVLPTDDPRIVRVDMTKSDLGARKSVTGKLSRKNDNSITHVPNGV